MMLKKGSQNGGHSKNVSLQDSIPEKNRDKKVDKVDFQNDNNYIEVFDSSFDDSNNQPSLPLSSNEKNDKVIAEKHEDILEELPETYAPAHDEMSQATGFRNNEIRNTAENSLKNRCSLKTQNRSADKSAELYNSRIFIRSSKPKRKERISSEKISKHSNSNLNRRTLDIEKFIRKCVDILSN
jgi:hypothetical protein